jgi:hypothetical protein
MLRMRKNPEKNAQMPLKNPPSTKIGTLVLHQKPLCLEAKNPVPSHQGNSAPLQATHRLSLWIVPQGDSQK